MSPDSHGGMPRADRDLMVADKLIADLPDIAARHADMAAFHAAQAFLFERTGTVATTHRGVRAEFSRIAKDLPGVPAGLLRFLGEAYRFKEIADDGADRARDITPEQARAALAHARAFVTWVRAVA